MIIGPRGILAREVVIASGVRYGGLDRDRPTEECRRTARFVVRPIVREDVLRVQGRAGEGSRRPSRIRTDEFKAWLDTDAVRLADVIKKFGKVE
jgi:hypothetical protein